MDGGQRHYMHAGFIVLAVVIVAILLMACVHKSSIALEKKGRRSCDRTRPAHVLLVLMDFLFGLGAHPPTWRS